MTNIGHKFLGVVVSLAKAFFTALSSIVWGISGFFLLAALISYYKADASTIETTLKLMIFVQKNWLYFFVAIFIFEFITDFKDFIRPVYTNSATPTIETIKNKVEVKL